MTAAPRLIAAARIQAGAGTGVCCSGIPVVRAATRRSRAMPRAVPSWAEVLMIPAAVARSLWATLVPRLVAATDDSPIPPPPATTVKGDCPCAGGRGDERCITDRDGSEARGDHALRWPAGEARGRQSRADDDRKAEREQRGCGGQRAQPARVLQVQGRECDRRAGSQGVQQGADRTLTQRWLAQQRPRQQRRFGCPVDDDEQPRQDERHPDQGGAEVRRALVGQ